MAQDLEKLVVQLSADFRQFQRESAKASGIANKEFRAIEDRARLMNRNLDSIGRNAARSLIAPFMGISAVLGGRELIRMTGVWTDLNSRLANTVGPDQAAATMERLTEMARRTYSSIEQTTEGFLSYSATLTALGYSTSQQLDFVESLNNALVVSGARGDVAARVMDALSKAMALGTLQGDNLNTVIASGGRVAQALAESMGVTVIELRRLGQEGRIGRREMMGVTTQLAQLREEAGRMPGTIQDGFLLLNNALLEYVGRGDQAVGVSARIAEALTMIADNFETVADAGLQVAAVIAGALVGRAMFGMIRSAGQGVVALAALTRALSQVRTASAALAAFGGLGAAAGPAALVIGGALVASLIAYSYATDGASSASSRWRARMREAEEQARSTSAAAQEVAEAMGNAARSQAQEALPALAEDAEFAGRAVADITTELTGLISAAMALRGSRLISAEQHQQLDEMRRGLADGSLDAAMLLARLRDLRGAGEFGELISEIRAVANELARAHAIAQAINQEVTEASRQSRNPLSDRQMEGYRQYAGSRTASAENDRRAAEFLAEQARLASRTRDQIALERELASVREAAAATGIELTQAQIERRARENLAAREAANPSRTRTGGGRGRQDQYTREVQQVRQQIAALEAEAAAITGVGLSLGGYADAAEYAQRRLELMHAAQQQGLAITPQLQAEIDALALSYVNAGNAVDQARERHEQFRQAVEETRGVMEQAFTGLVTGAHSFKDALRMVIAKLAEMAASRAFAQLWEGGMGSGVGGFLKRLLGFERGGYTGAGGRSEPAGVVHKGEVVWSQDDVRRVGGPAAAEAIRKGMPGYAKGGVVGRIPQAAQLVPRMPKPATAAAPAAPEIQMSASDLTLTDDGRIMASVRAQLVQGLAVNNRQMQRELPNRIQAHLAQPRKRP